MAWRHPDWIHNDEDDRVLEQAEHDELRSYAKGRIPRGSRIPSRTRLTALSPHGKRVDGSSLPCGSSTRPNFTKEN